MIFSTELANEVKLSDNSNNTKYLEAGIHDNVKFVSAKFAESPTGKKFIEFTFEKDGKSLVHTEWEPAVREGDTEEQNQSKATNQVTRIMRILKCFYPKNVLAFSGSSYKEFANWVVTMLNSANKDILLKVKIVYNNKGYTTLPNYCKFTFIEPMNLPEGQKSKITELNIDLFVRPVVADKENKEENPLDTISTDTQESGNDLPF